MTQSRTAIGRRDTSRTDSDGPLLEVKDLQTHFKTGRGMVRAVDGVTFTLERGKALGVVGESGSGKTTLVLALLRLLSSEGRIVFLGRDIQGVKSSETRELRADMQIVFQDPFGSLSPRMVVRDIVAEA